MKAKLFILGMARRRRIVTADVVRKLGISRQTACGHLRDLVAAGKLVKTGSTRAAGYGVPSSGRSGAPTISPPLSVRYPTPGLNEDRVFREVALKLNLKRLLSERAYGIAEYAFTEMLNNAIEHSRAPSVSVLLQCRSGNFEFEVRDRGIGAFESIRRKFHFGDHFAAVEHLMKGKQTVDPVHHTGQGIFFTSKIADRFSLDSARLRWIVDHLRDDTFLEDIPNLCGTRVSFSLKQKSKRDLKKLFQDYSNDEFEFDKTKIIVHLSEKNDRHVSRSEARRLLFGLDKFRRIVLDFKRVRGIGQGFADELFRVFRLSHPHIRLEPIRMSESVAFMVNRVES